MKSKRSRKKEAIKALETAFKCVRLDDGVSLHETAEIDNYRRILPNSRNREKDELHDWKKLVCSNNLARFCWNGGISFFDAKGFHFHLPAYLTTEIRSYMLGDITDILISAITAPAEYRKEGFILFSPSQKKAVLNAVLYLHDFDLYPLDPIQVQGLYKNWGN